MAKDHGSGSIREENAAIGFRLLGTPAEQLFETGMIGGTVVIVRDVLIELEIHL